MVECNSGSSNDDSDMLKIMITDMDEQARSRYHFGASRLHSRELELCFPFLGCSDVAITGSWMVVSLRCIVGTRRFPH